jgi:hypothetical protein
MREDSDGSLHYSLDEIFEGKVVAAAKGEDSVLGFWGTPQAATYPNPLYVKITRELWRRFPRFVFLAEVDWGREATAIGSGLIPQALGLSRCLGLMFNIQLTKSGPITYTSQKTNVNVFYDWYEVERVKYPQNSIILYPSSSHHLPSPTSLYGRGAWAAVDLLFFLPEIPMTFVGEMRGWSMACDPYDRKFFYPAPGLRSPHDLSEISGHYEHRSQLRKRHRVLREGGMVPLFAFHGKGWHDRVFAFARFTKYEGGLEMAIVAINFSDTESFFCIDYSPLEEIRDRSNDQNELDQDLIFQISDLINMHAAPQYYSSDEFLNEKNFIQLYPYHSLCWGVKVIANSPSTERLLFEHSMQRLKDHMQHHSEPEFNMIFSMLTKGLASRSLLDNALNKIAVMQPPTQEENLPPLLQSVLYYISRKDNSDAKILALLQQLGAGSSSPLVKKLVNKTLERNSLVSQTQVFFFFFPFL